MRQDDDDKQLEQTISKMRKAGLILLLIAAISPFAAIGYNYVSEVNNRLYAKSRKDWWRKQRGRSKYVSPQKSVMAEIWDEQLGRWNRWTYTMQENIANYTQSFASINIVEHLPWANTPENILRGYLSEKAISGNRYKYICEKNSLLPSEIRSYYKDSLDISGKVNKIKPQEFAATNSKKSRSKRFFIANWELDGKEKRSRFEMSKHKNGKYCVFWSHGERYWEPLDRLIRYKNDRIKAIIQVKLGNDYPPSWDWREKSRFNSSSHMSLDFGSLYLNNLLLPYNGNEAVYEYLANRSGKTYIKTTIEKCGLSSKFDFCARYAKIIDYSPLRD